MTEQSVGPATPDTGRRAVILLRLVFFFSGAAGLIYQVVWQRLLTVYYGVGPVATTLIVSTYMLGLGLGALLGGAAAERTKFRVTLYMLVELLLGTFGAASPWLLDLLGRNTAGASYPVALLWMALFLSLPTLLMGTTLPLLTKAVNAVAGDFLKSLRLPVFHQHAGGGSAPSGELRGHLAVRIGHGGLRRGGDQPPAGRRRLPAPRARSGGRLSMPAKAGTPTEDGGGTLGRWAYLCVFATGFLAIAYEILWFRSLGVLMKDSPYSFSTILAVYLFGIALGSFGMALYRQSRLRLQGQATFFFMQFLIGAYLWTSFAGFCCLDGHVAWIHEAIDWGFQEPLQPLPLMTTWAATWQSAGLYLTVLVYPLIFVFVPTLLMGASFPLVASLALRRPDARRHRRDRLLLQHPGQRGRWDRDRLLAPGGVRHGAKALGLSIVGLSALLLVDRFGGWRPQFIWRAAAFAVLAAAAVLTFPGRGEFYGLVHGEPEEGRDRYLAEGVDAVVVTDDGPDGTDNWINGLSHGNRPSPWYTREAFEAFSYAPSAGTCW